MAYQYNIKTFIHHKDGESYKGCHDRSQIYKDNGNKLGLAIADGAGSSFFPAFWAECLVENFSSLDVDRLKETPEDIEAALDFSREKWFDYVKKRVEEGVPWFTENQFFTRKVAGSTMTLLNLSKEGAWSTMAIGDCFLFIFNEENKLCAQIPSEDDPSLYPDYLSSYKEEGKGDFSFEQGQLSGTGKIILATDALGYWINRFWKEDIFEDFLNVENHDQFVDFISAQRKKKNLKDDDVALMIIDTISMKNDESSVNITHQDLIKQLIAVELDGSKAKTTGANGIKEPKPKPMSIPDPVPVAQPDPDLVLVSEPEPEEVSPLEPEPMLVPAPEKTELEEKSVPKEKQAPKKVQAANAEAQIALKNTEKEEKPTEEKEQVAIAEVFEQDDKSKENATLTKQNTASDGEKEKKDLECVNSETEKEEKIASDEDKLKTATKEALESSTNRQYDSPFEEIKKSLLGLISGIRRLIFGQAR